MNYRSKFYRDYNNSLLKMTDKRIYCWLKCVFNYFQLKPHRRNFVKDIQQAVRYLRTKARDHIRERIASINRGDTSPDDILSFMIKCAGE